MVPFPSIGVSELVRASLVLAIEPFPVVGQLLCLGFRRLQDGIQNLVDIYWGSVGLSLLLFWLGWRVGTCLCWRNQFLTILLFNSFSWDISVLVETHGDNLVRRHGLSFLFWLLDGLVLDLVLCWGTLLGGYRWLCFCHFAILLFAIEFNVYNFWLNPYAFDLNFIEIKLV